MKPEKRLIDANAYAYPGDLINEPTVDAVEVEKYNDLREAFVDYVCSGTQNPAPYCRNRCVDCVDRRGWCISQSDKCRGFNPDGERRTNV